MTTIEDLQLICFSDELDNCDGCIRYYFNALAAWTIGIDDFITDYNNPTKKILDLQLNTHVFLNNTQLDGNFSYVLHEESILHPTPPSPEENRQMEAKQTFLFYVK